MFVVPGSSLECVRMVWQGVMALLRRLCELQKVRSPKGSVLCRMPASPLASAAKCFPKIRPPFSQEEARLRADASPTQCLLIAFSCFSQCRRSDHAHSPACSYWVWGGKPSQSVWNNPAVVPFPGWGNSRDPGAVPGNGVEEGVPRKGDSTTQPKSDQPFKRKN